MNIPIWRDRNIIEITRKYAPIIEVNNICSICGRLKLNCEQHTKYTIPGNPITIDVTEHKCRPNNPEYFLTRKLGVLHK